MLGNISKAENWHFGLFLKFLEAVHWISGWLFQCLNRIISFDDFLLQTNMTTLKFVFSFLAFCVFFQRWTRGGMTQLQRGRGDALTNCGISYVPIFLCSAHKNYILLSHSKLKPPFKTEISLQKLNVRNVRITILWQLLLFAALKIHLRRSTICN